jgi:PAS domain-containing protein
VSADAEARIIDALYRGTRERDEFERAIALLAVMFDSPSVVLGAVDMVRPEVQLTIGVGVVDSHQLSRYAEFAKLDPVSKPLMAMRPGTAATTLSLCPDVDRRRDPFINEYLRPIKLAECLAGPIYAEPGRFALIGVHQEVGRRQFDDGDAARLERLMPHLARALQLRRAFLDVERRGEVLAAIVDRCAAGMIGIDADGLVLFVNRAARDIAEQGDGIGLDRYGRLVVADRAAARHVARLQADVSAGGAGGTIRLARPSGLPACVLLVAPLPPPEVSAHGGRRGTLFVIHDPMRRRPPTEQRIAHLLHLPMGAAKVVGAVLDGEDLRDYAERAGISMNTVRFHLKTAFARTDTHSQAELVRLAMSALADLDPHFSEPT